MHGTLGLVPLAPIIGFLTLSAAGPKLTRRQMAMIGVGGIGASLILSVTSAVEYWRAGIFWWRQELWQYLNTSGLQVSMALRMDSLSLVMVLVVSLVGLLIAIYSVEYMRESEGYGRFFAYMNLFVACMLVLVLADDLLLLYFGWEGVGLCSYLLIGFEYQRESHGRAAQKAFIVTRIGDALLAVGLIMLFADLGTLRIDQISARAVDAWPAASAAPTMVAFFILGGAIAKSAQLPLQVWLPDAMVGPTPVSALIHAATMVAAGVYLIARMQAIFVLAPAAMRLVAIIGAVTLLIAGCSAYVQTDIKKALAYSTISQLGYMFLALGLGAWSAAIFHFTTHAAFKALLFLAAGAVIVAQNHQQNMLAMGGLRKQLRLVFWTFLAGASSLAGLPLITSGFFSKDAIIWESIGSARGNGWLLAAGMVGSLLTGLYAFRIVFLVFFGQTKIVTDYRPNRMITWPLVILAVLALVMGIMELPPGIGHGEAFSRFLQSTLPRPSGAIDRQSLRVAVLLGAAIVPILGGAFAYLFWHQRRSSIVNLAASAARSPVHEFWLKGWGFDSLYQRVAVDPYLWIAKINQGDFLDYIYRAVSLVTRTAYRGLTATVTGRLRWYAATIAMGAVVIMLALVISS